MNTIICAVSSVHASEGPISAALSLARSMSARLIVAHVHERDPLTIDDDERQRLDDGARAVAFEAMLPVDADADVELVGLTGEVATRLAALAVERDAGAIVVGARRRGRSGTVYRSRTIGELSRHTSIPVLMATGAAKPARPAAAPSTAPAIDPTNRHDKARTAKRAGRSWAQTTPQLRPRPARRA